jgi:hypothetical protein
MVKAIPTGGAPAKGKISGQYKRKLYVCMYVCMLCFVMLASVLAANVSSFASKLQHTWESSTKYGYFFFGTKGVKKE